MVSSGLALKMATGGTYLACDLAHHIPLRPLKVPEGLANVELDVVALALHADPDQDPALRIQIQPKLSRQVIAEMHRIQLQRRAPDKVMITNHVVVPDRHNKIERPGHGNVDRLVPARVEVPHNHPGLVKALLVLVAQDHVGITGPVGVAGLQLLALDDLDCEHVVSRSPPGLLRPVDLVEQFGEGVHVHALL